VRRWPFAILAAAAVTLSACGKTSSELRTSAPDRVVVGAKPYKEVADCLAIRMNDIAESYDGTATTFPEDARQRVTIVVRNAGGQIGMSAEVEAADGQTRVEIKDGLPYTIFKEYLDKAESAAKGCMTAS